MVLIRETERVRHGLQYKGLKGNGAAIELCTNIYNIRWTKTIYDFFLSNVNRSQDLDDMIIQFALHKLQTAFGIL